MQHWGVVVAGFYRMLNMLSLSGITSYLPHIPQMECVHSGNLRTWGARGTQSEPSCSSAGLRRGGGQNIRLLCNGPKQLSAQVTLCLGCWFLHFHLSVFCAILNFQLVWRLLKVSTASGQCGKEALLSAELPQKIQRLKKGSRGNTRPCNTEAIKFCYWQLHHLLNSI